MKRFVIVLFFLTGISSITFAQMGGMMGKGMHDISPMLYERSTFTEEMHISRGGQLYDDWFKTTVDAKKPENDHPLWKQQTSNKRSRYDTYRCKECHGWDYRGKDGAYSKGSHYTGFIGVQEAANKMTINELEAVLKGSKNNDHDYTKYLSDNDISDLALFLKKGLIDIMRIVNSDGTPVEGNLNSGNNTFMNTCMHMCHGGLGTMINFGDSEKPEYLGTVANENPWEFVHKVRSGQPGTRMPSAIINEWKEQDIRDLLAFARTLPTDTPQISWFARIKRGMGFGKDHHERNIANEYRGFGPIKE